MSSHSNRRWRWLALLGWGVLSCLLPCEGSPAADEPTYQPWIGTWAGEGSWRKYEASVEAQPETRGALVEEATIQVEIGIYAADDRAYVSYSWRMPGKSQVGDGGYMHVSAGGGQDAEAQVDMAGAEPMRLTLHRGESSKAISGTYQASFRYDGRVTTIVHQFDGLREAEERPFRQGEAHFARLRERMVAQQLRPQDITDERVLGAMSRVPRHRFVADAFQLRAYQDGPLPIGFGQTISQPYIVALMTQLARPDADDRVLDIGTGSGYQAAVLAELCKEVYGIEIINGLAEQSQRRLNELGYENVTVKQGDGYLGWPEHAPFDVIIVAAAPDHVPRPLVEQLAPGGRLVMPVGSGRQTLVVIEKSEDGRITQRQVIPVAFVRMTGRAQGR